MYDWSVEIKVIYNHSTDIATMAIIQIFVFFFAVATTASDSLPPNDLEYLLLALSNQLTPEHNEDNSYRLPKSVVPLQYDIKLIPYLAGDNFTFDGSVAITVEALESVDKISFHVLNLTIDSKLITVKEFLEPHKQVPVQSVEEDIEHEFYTLNLATRLIENTSYVIDIPKFTGKPNGYPVGFFRSSYKVNGTERFLAATQFEATHARRAFPCFDEPALKARFKIAISRPEDLRAISNMPQEGQPQIDTEHTDIVRYWDHFQETPLMSSYLVAFVVSDFEYLDPKMRIFAEPALVNHTRYALSHSKGLLDWLAEFLGVSYDMPKMDQVAVPNFGSGAMENWGLVTYRPSILLIDEQNASTYFKQQTTMVIAHEFAHQWFGDLVSPKWWKYLWLNEGFASYFQYLAVAKRQPEWRMDEQFVTDSLQYAMHFEEKINHPMTVNVSTPLEIAAIFDPISYGKSGSVIRMMESIVTTQTFRKGLQHYLQTKSYSSATDDNLFDSLAKQMQADNVTYNDINFKDAMKSWTLQGGYPVLNVTRDYDNEGTAYLAQKRFLKDPGSVDDTKQSWYIPLTYTNQMAADFESTRPRHWLTPQDTSARITKLGSNSQWVLFNVKAIGYYRVNYDDRNWELLTAYLKSPAYQTIPPVNRAQLLDDAFSIAAAGMVPYRVPLALSIFLRQDKDYIPWRSGHYALKDLAEKFSVTPDKEVFAKFYQHLYESVYAHLGLVAGANDNHVTRLSRAAVVKQACHAGEKKCVERAVTSVKQWIADKNTTIDPDLREAFYCAAVRFGDNRVDEFFRKQQRECEVPSERDIILRARGCSEDQSLLRSYLEEALADDYSVRKQEKMSVFESVYAHPVGLNVAFNYVTKHFGKITKFFGCRIQVVKMIYKMATHSNNPAHIYQLKQLLSVNANEIGPYAPVIEKAVEIIGKNNQWYDKFGKEIIQWINEYFASLPSPRPL